MAGKPEDMRENAGLPLELVGGEFLESESLSEERLPERQYCVFRAGRERFCLSVLEVEEVVDWPIVTQDSSGTRVLDGSFQPPRHDRSANRYRVYGSTAAGSAAEARGRRGA